MPPAAAPETVPAPVPAPPVHTGSAVPPSKGEIHVIPQPVEAEGARPGSAKERMFQDLRKKAKPTEGPATVTPQKPAAAPKPPESAPVSGASDDQGDEGGAAPAPPVEGEKGEKGKKASPWKLVEEYKKRVLDAETRLAEATKGQPNEESRKQQQAEFEAYKKRAQELEDEIRYVNYSKSQEFQQKYQEPYNKAWERAMAEMKEIPVTDPSTGDVRAVDPQDMLTLVNLPLGQARDMAEQMFGKFTDDVMAYRKEIRSLFDAQSAALEEAKKSGAARDQQRMAQWQEFQNKTRDMISEAWTKANESVRKDAKFGKYFTPVEGDDEGNAKLEKGYALVDKAFGENPYAPNLKPEERQEIIRRHAAVRNRAAAFGRDVARIEKLEAMLAERDEKLKQYEASEPPTGGGTITPPGGAPMSAKEAMLADLRTRAK